MTDVSNMPAGVKAATRSAISSAMTGVQPQWALNVSLKVAVNSGTRRASGTSLQRDDLIPGTTGGLKRALPAGHQFRLDRDLVIHPALLRLEARIFEQPVIIHRVLVHEIGRQRVVIVQDEGELQQTEARPRGFHP